ncbi:type II 3-dehydroquinate dehydratase [Rhizomicrobium electricum]|uniref:3-dehydroquinate dehydratase n=1 Tax=Rhizomicrobium electricum TaxID=480070 RepID=A0ABP3P6W4_9PROT|nr:type II 3-dehydroquinate dehydratase [Rhizomicrobium electricum]NIJ47665.1 3-dehydroquinate dehydratase-2 [Rhizomicrobium electricum]
MSKAIYVLNGPNLNLLGTREPNIYGRTTLADIGDMTVAEAKAHGFDVVFRQSNHEGELVEWIQEAREAASGVIINAGAYTHTSVAIHDALRALAIPVVEVHLSNTFSREEFRHRSLISPVAKGLIVGFGANSYVLAVDALASLIEEAAE